MVFSYNWLQSFFKKRLPEPEKLAELLTLHFAEVQELKKEGKPARNASPARQPGGSHGGGHNDAGGDFILDIDVRPNRASDCFSHLGIAREIAAITNLIFIAGAEKVKLIEDKDLKTKDFVSVEVKDKKACERYTARVISNVKVGPSPKWVRERLEVCGLRPINNIVDIANYVMLETGQPLHAFDLAKLEGLNPKSQILNPKKIIVRFAKTGERITTLDGEEYDLDKNILVIADAKKPVAIAGIKGGKPPEITENTKIVVLESANFNSRVIRRGSKIIDLKTDASWRFEHGIDPNLTEFAVNRAIGLIKEIAGGEITQGLVDFYPRKVLPKKIKLDIAYVGGLLGVKIPRTQIKKILKNLGFGIVEVRPRPFPQWLIVEVPTRRLDILMPEDLIEEIGRIYGYQKIPSIFPTAALIPPERNLDIFWEDLAKDILKEAGFTEVYNYSFLSEKDTEIFGLTERKIFELENPLSSDFKYLRPSLIPNLLKNIQKNQKYFREIKISELGKIFQPPKSEARMLAGLMTGDVFYQAKGVVDSLLNKLGISNIWYDEYRAALKKVKTSWWNPKKSAEIKVGQELVGFLGEISPRILDKLEIAQKVIYFDIFFEKLSKIASEEHEYRPISRFPAAVRDIAVLVPRFVRVEEVLNEIYGAGGPLILDVDLFDIYEGEELPEEKKNLAFHIIYQANDRTLTSEEIDQLQQKIIKALEENDEWEIRK